MEVIKLLLEHNGQTNIFDSNGHTNLPTAAFHDDNIEMIHLIEHGANVDAKANGGKTALELAKENGHISVAELLGQQGPLNNFKRPFTKR